MPKKNKKAKPAKVKETKSSKSKPSKETKAANPAASTEETLISSKVVYQGPLFRVLHDKLLEPGGKPASAT